MSGVRGKCERGGREGCVRGVLGVSEGCLRGVCESDV